MKLIRAAPLLIVLSASGEPPTEFRLFRTGVNKTTKGPFTLDPDDALACVEAQKEYGNDLSIDFGHGAFEEGKGGPAQGAAGWIPGLEARPDGLYAVGVWWTDAGADKLRKKEQRYHSPAFESVDGHIRAIINCALTLIPASHDLIPLVASRTGTGGVAARKLNTMADKYCKAAALTALADEMDKDEGASDEKKAMSKMLRNLAEDSEELKLAEDDGEETTSEDDPPSEKAEKQAASRIVKIAREITGKSTPAEVSGALLAMRDTGEQIATLSKQVKELTSKTTGAEVSELISKASRAGRLTPAKAKWAATQFAKDVPGLKAYLSVCDPVVGMQDGRAVETASGADEGAPLKITALSAEQKKLLRKAGVNTEDEKAVVAFLNRQTRQLPRGSNHGPL